MRSPRLDVARQNEDVLTHDSWISLELTLRVSSTVLSRPSDTSLPSSSSRASSPGGLVTSLPGVAAVEEEQREQRGTLLMEDRWGDISSTWMSNGLARKSSTSYSPGSPWREASPWREELAGLGVWASEVMVLELVEVEGPAGLTARRLASRSEQVEKRLKEDFLGTEFSSDRYLKLSQLWTMLAHTNL